MIGGHHRHRGIGIAAGNEQGCQADAGGRVPLAGFSHEARFRERRGLPPDHVEQPRGGDHHGSLRRHEAVKPGHGVLEKRPFASQWQELFR